MTPLLCRAVALALGLVPGAQPQVPGPQQRPPAPATLPAQGPLQREPAGLPRASTTFDSKAIGGPVGLSVYLPPGYDTSAERYPVIYALHGMFENATFWERRGLKAAYEDLVKAGTAPLAIVVTVDGGNSLFVNSPRGSYQDLVTQDLVEYVDNTYRTIARREGRALLGVSMGGYGALGIAFSAPRAFGAVATHSAMLLSEVPTPEAGARGGQMRAFTSVFGEPVDVAMWKSKDPLEQAKSAETRGLPALYFDCGSSDRYGLFVGNEALHRTLESRKVPHEFGLYPGDHGYEFVKSVFARSLAFLKEKLVTR